MNCRYYFSIGFTHRIIVKRSEIYVCDFFGTMPQTLAYHGKGHSLCCGGLRKRLAVHSGAAFWIVGAGVGYRGVKRSCTVGNPLRRWMKVWVGDRGIWNACRCTGAGYRRHKARYRPIAAGGFYAGGNEWCCISCPFCGDGRGRRTESL